LNKIYAWSNKWGFKLSANKSAAILFTRRRKIPEMILKLGSNNIPIKSEFKYLGITFQRNGTYHKHTKVLQDKCAKRLNLLRAVKVTTWGVAKAPMLSLYRSLIRSITNYGMEV